MINEDDKILEFIKLQLCTLILKVVGTNILRFRLQITGKKNIMYKILKCILINKL